MKKLILSYLAVTFFILGFQKSSFATHVEGADISFQSLGNDSFLVTVNFYRSCAVGAVAAPNQMTIRERHI